MAQMGDDKKGKSAEEVWQDDLATKRAQKRKKADDTPDQIELRDRWLELYPHRHFSGGGWWLYRSGWWREVDEEVIKGEVTHICEAAIPEGVKITSGLVESIHKLAQVATYTPPETLGANNAVLVFGNGTMNLDTDEFREHRPDDFATVALPFEYDPEAKCKTYQSVVEGALGDAADFFQEFAGLCLTPDVDFELALWLKGPRGAGKSTIIEGLTAMLDDKSDVLGLAEIERSSFALSRIPGKTLLVSTEQPASFVKSTHIIDALISGESLTIERKYRDAIKAQPVAKVLWAMNELPRIASATSGIFRRVKVIEFGALKGEPDPLLKHKIRRERAGILNWALEGLKRLYDRERFEMPESVRAATDEFVKINDLAREFIDERCQIGPMCSAGKDELYKAYREWALESGYQPKSKSELGKDLNRLSGEYGFEDFKGGKGRRFWQGIEPDKRVWVV